MLRHAVVGGLFVLATIPALAQQVSPGRRSSGDSAADRIVAERILRLGGAVILEGQQRPILDLDELPDADFRLHTLDLVGVSNLDHTKVSDAGIAKLTELTRLVGNGIPERYWIPPEFGADYELTPCLAPLKSLRADIHVISGIDNPNARATAPGNTHHKSMSALVSGTPYTGRGAGGASIDQVIAGAMGGESRFRSLQVGVCQESHGENIHRNLSWAGYDRALPPEMIPQNLFDRLFGVRDQSWVGRKKSVLDAVREDLTELQPSLSEPDRHRLDEHLTSVRELERSIASLPSDYGKNVKEPEDVADLTNYPRIAKMQSDLVVHALASGQTRVASYMLTKCQSLTRLPWLGYTRLRHHDYTHTNAESPEGQRIMRDICRWHVEEFAYLLGRLKAVPEGDGTLLDHTCVVFAHEHAEANPHKDNGLALILAGHAGGMKTGMHSKMRNTIGDLYLTVAEEVFKLPLEKGFPTAEKKISGIV